jgi:hypothetical protein
MNDLEGARDCFELVLSVDEKIFGSNDPQVVTDLTNLGIAMHELGDFHHARLSYERALTILETKFPENHPKMITVRKYLDRLKTTSGLKERP